MEMKKHKTISEAQHAIMKELRMLLKDSESEAGKYSFDYTSAAFAAASIRPLMIKHGIVKFPVKATNMGRYGNGTGVDVDYVFRYKLVGAETLEEGITYDDVPVSGSGKVGKSGDKSIFACATTTGKYADLFYFYLPMVDDIEAFDEIMDVMSQETEIEEPPKKKLKTSKSSPEPEEEEEPEEDMEIPGSSSDMNYSDDPFSLIEDLYEQAGIEAVLKFTEGDTRNKIEDLVEDLKADAGYSDEDVEEEPEEEEEVPEEEEETAEETDEEAVDLDELDYDDPETVAAIMEQIDLYSEGEGFAVEDVIDEFEDPEQLKMFYTRALETVSEEDPQYAEEFNEANFEHMQDRYTELGGG